MGTPMAGAGLSASLRDLARFGDLLRCEGECNGKQLIPASAVPSKLGASTAMAFVSRRRQRW